MNTELRRWRSENFGNDYLPTICIDLRMAVNGAADHWPDKLVVETVNFLKRVLSSWEPSRPQEEWMDECVQELVQATIRYTREDVQKIGWREEQENERLAKLAVGG